VVGDRLHGGGDNVRKASKVLLSSSPFLASLLLYSQGDMYTVTPLHVCISKQTFIIAFLERTFEFLRTRHFAYLGPVYLPFICI
jgi:hypothetical protein